MTTPVERRVVLADPASGAAGRLSVSVGVAVGFGASVFGVGLPWLAVAALTVLGLTLSRDRVLLLLAVGLLGGSMLYIGLGMAMELVGAPSIGSGSGGPSGR